MNNEKCSGLSLVLSFRFFGRVFEFFNAVDRLL